MRVAFVLAGLLLLGWSAAIIAAGVQIRTIVFTGPIAGVLGVLMAMVFARLRWRTLSVASLTVPLVSLLVYFLIFCNRWSPQQARQPVMVLLLGYELLAGLLWLAGMWNVIHASPQRVLKLQFPLRSLMIVTLIVAAALGAGRLALRQSPTVLLAVAVGLFAAVAGALVWLGIAALLMDSPRPKSAAPA